MGPSAWDARVTASAPAQTRRWLLALLAALPLGGVLTSFGAEEATAERPHERLGRRTEQRHRKQRDGRRSNTTHHHHTAGGTHTAGGNPTAGGDLPDVGRVTCWFTCTVRNVDCNRMCEEHSGPFFRSCLVHCNQTADPISDCTAMGDQRLAAFRLACFPQCDQIRDHCVNPCGVPGGPGAPCFIGLACASGHGDLAPGSPTQGQGL